jgi:hypothetical protein
MSDSPASTKRILMFDTLRSGLVRGSHTLRAKQLSSVFHLTDRPDFTPTHCSLDNSTRSPYIEALHREFSPRLLLGIRQESACPPIVPSTWRPLVLVG